MVDISGFILEIKVFWLWGNVELWSAKYFKIGKTFLAINYDRIY